jgi:hypothetical protein
VNNKEIAELNFNEFKKELNENRVKIEKGDVGKKTIEF